MSKKKPFLSFEEEVEHHKEFIRHFEKRIDPILEKAANGFKIEELMPVFERMYEWTIKHLQKFEDSAFELLIELLSNFVEKQKEHEARNNIQEEIAQLFFLQLFIKVYTFFENIGKQDHFQSALMYILAKKLVKFEIKSMQELFFGLLALIISQDLLRKNSFFFPEVNICLERVFSYFETQVKDKNLSTKTSSAKKATKENTVETQELITVCKGIFEAKETPSTPAFYQTTYTLLNKVLNSYHILFRSDSNCDITMSNLNNIIQKLNNIPAFKFSENTINNFVNLLETCKTKFDMNVIKDKPLIKIKQLTPKFDDSDTEVVQGDYDEEVKKEKQKLKKAVNRESKRAQRELAYDSLVLQTQKDKERAEQDERKKSSFKKFAKFMQEQELEGKRIKTTQLQHQKRVKHKSRRMAGNKTDPGNKK